MVWGEGRQERTRIFPNFLRNSAIVVIKCSSACAYFNSSIVCRYSPVRPGPVVLPRVGVPLPPPEISGGYYYSPPEVPKILLCAHSEDFCIQEFITPPPPPFYVKSTSSPFPKSVSDPLTNFDVSDDVFDEPEISRVRSSISDKCLAHRKW